MITNTNNDNNYHNALQTMQKQIEDYFGPTNIETLGLGYLEEICMSSENDLDRRYVQQLLLYNAGAVPIQSIATYFRDALEECYETAMQDDNDGSESIVAFIARAMRQSHLVEVSQCGCYLRPAPVVVEPHNNPELQDKVVSPDAPNTVPTTISPTSYTTTSDSNASYQTNPSSSADHENCAEGPPPPHQQHPAPVPQQQASQYHPPQHKSKKPTIPKAPSCKRITMMMITTILIVESFVGLVVLLGASDRASDLAETQQHANPSIVAMPTTGRLLFHIPAVDVLGCENKNDFANTDTTIDGITDPLDALELNTEDGAVHTPVTPASDFPVVEARLNDEAEVEETPARVYINDNPRNNPRVRQVLPLNDGFVVLRMPSDPLLVWEVDAVLLLETFLRDHAASVPVGYNPDYDLEQPMREVLPLTPRGRVVFRHPSDPYTVWSVDALALFVFICDCREAFADHYDKYYEGATPEDEDLQSATAVHDADDAADSNSNTEEPTVQADETCGDDGSNATESTRLENPLLHEYLGRYPGYDRYRAPIQSQNRRSRCLFQ